jgi:hypothetical protein
MLRGEGGGRRERGERGEGGEGEGGAVPGTSLFLSLVKCCAGHATEYLIILASVECTFKITKLSLSF